MSIFSLYKDGTDLMHQTRNCLFFHMPVLVISFSGSCQILAFANKGHMFPQRSLANDIEVIFVIWAGKVKSKRLLLFYLYFTYYFILFVLFKFIYFYFFLFDSSYLFYLYHANSVKLHQLCDLAGIVNKHALVAQVHNLSTKQSHVL